METENSEPAPTYLKLRERILSLLPEGVGLSATGQVNQVWGVIIETGYEVGTATLVALADGTTSLYYSTGGGMLGSADYLPLADSSKALVASANLYLSQLDKADEIPLPAAGQVRFTFLTFGGKFSTAVDQSSLTAGDHQLSPLYTQSLHTLDQLRVLVDKNRK